MTKNKAIPVGSASIYTYVDNSHSNITNLNNKQWKIVRTNTNKRRLESMVTIRPLLKAHTNCVDQTGKTYNWLVSSEMFLKCFYFDITSPKY